MYSVAYIRNCYTALSKSHQHYGVSVACVCCSATALCPCMCCRHNTNRFSSLVLQINQMCECGGMSNRATVCVCVCICTFSSLHCPRFLSFYSIPCWNCGPRMHAISSTHIRHAYFERRRQLLTDAHILYVIHMCIYIYLKLYATYINVVTWNTQFFQRIW